MMLARQLIHKTLIALVMLFTLSVVAQADETIEPQVLVERAVDKMLQALNDNQRQLLENPNIIYGLVKDILLPDFDFDKMSKLALGKNWRKASEPQRAEFTEEFRLLLVRTYSTAMLEYSHQEIRTLPFHGDLATKKVRVGMEILQAGGPSIPMVSALYLNKEGSWKVYDIKIDGISLVTTYRSTFSSQIRSDGMEKLIEKLAKKNEKIKKYE